MGLGAVRGTASTGHARRVLLVDDNAVNRLVGQAMLEQLGFVVGVAGDGAEGVQLALQACSELVLMDLQMPGLDGLAATRLLRERESEAGIRATPVVAVTGYHPPRSMRSAATPESTRC